MTRKLRCAGLSAILFVTSACGVAQAGQTYWVCDDAQGNKTAQDHPCDPSNPSKNRREARPNVVPSMGGGIAGTAVPPEVRTSVEKLAAHAPVLSPIVIKAIAGFGVVAVLVLVVFAIGGLFRRIRDRNRQDEVEGRRHEARGGQKTPLLWPFYRRPKVWSQELIRSLGVKRFEELCAGLWAAEGLRTELAGSETGGGITIRFFEPDDPGKLAGIIQCQSGLTEPVGVNFVRELYGNIADARAGRGALATSDEFTADARLYAGGKPIELVDGAMLLQRLLALPEGRRSALLKQITRRGYRA